MKEYGFQFAVLRYMHDPVTQEFINVGVVLYSSEARYLKARTKRRLGRISQAFASVTGARLRGTLRYLESQVGKLEHELRVPTFFRQAGGELRYLLESILPPDDSSLVFGSYGGGLARDLDEQLDSIFDRMVMRYVRSGDGATRSDDDVWATYRVCLGEVGLLQRLEAATIHTPTYEHIFRHAYRNEGWHALEPLSFDLASADGIHNKAMRWIGIGRVLSKADDMARLYLLVGEPSQSELREPYSCATQNLEGELPAKVQLIKESQAVEFAHRFAREVGSQ